MLLVSLTSDDQKANLISNSFKTNYTENKRPDNYTNNIDSDVTATRASAKGGQAGPLHGAATLEGGKLAIEKQLELAKVRKESEKNPQTLESGEPSSITDKLESLVKSIKTLTIQVPVWSESFNLFFRSLEKAFQIKSVPDELKAEILLNILGEKVNILLTYVSQEDLSNYVKIKELILREFEPTPQECLSNFKKARKLPSENYVQFASRLSATFDNYCQLRKVNEFRSLCDLIISDKIFETLDRHTMNHIATKQGETYFKPQQLGRECDVYLSARGKVSNDLMSRNPGSGVKTDGRNRLQTVGTWRQERNSSNVFLAETKTNCVLCKGNNFHPLSKCYQFKKLSVEDRVEVVKQNNLCFRCFLPHKLKQCRSEKNCFCLRPHNSLIHFSRDKTRNPTPTSNLNLDAPTFVPGQIEGSVETNSQAQFVATGFEKGRPKNVFLSTVRALVKNKYSQCVEELGHLERVVESSEPPTHYYIPHHGVLRPEKLTTKLRIVFNGSSPTTTGISLNDILLKGEVKEDVFETISRFRRHKFAFTTDIQTMYRQILINPDQQDLQRIIWKHGPDAEVLTYRLKTVTYGLSNAPFLAIRTLQQLAKDEKSRFPLASETLLYDIYMDDIVSGAPDLETAQQLQSQLKDALQSCGMNLHKWSSNSPELLNSSWSSDVEHSFSTDIDLSVKTLGISWKPFEDCFVFKVSVSVKQIYTKREVLSVIAKLYDPLGFLGPVIAKAKVFLQQLWQCKLDCDDVLPNSIANEWREFVTTLKCIEEVKINIFIMADNNVIIVLQGFADASEVAYGVVVYLQCFLHNGAAKVSILASKSRVAPIRVISIPRLELCACVFLAQLVKKIRSPLRLNISDIVLHTDSTIALAWLNTPANRLKTFVANLVAKVQELTEGFQWNHVPSVLNPADLVSRGLRPCDLPNLRLWWHGPQFLEKGKLSSEETSLSPVKECEYSKELKTGSSSDKTSSICVSTNCVSSILSTLLCKSNSYMKIVRIFSYVLRFSNNVNKRKLTLSGPLSATDIDQAETKLIRMVQEQVFLAEIKSLQSKGVVSPNSKLRNLNPFIDSDGLLRVGGRLSNSDLPYVNKHPAILPGNHNLAVQIIALFHMKESAYWCFFSSTLSIHIEIVSDLTSDAFIATLKRFFSRRGKCAKLYSDNGKTFVGANKELKRFLKLIEDSDDNLAGFLSAEGIEWKFIPSRAPSFGGLWETSVKSQ
ncbi:integrase catalytic domain-containing protein [Trichonephila clavipes]|nr:integrase catalytic domain-containing protein [Trichonephila clavipes]